VADPAVISKRFSYIPYSAPAAASLSARLKEHKHRWLVH